MLLAHTVAVKFFSEHVLVSGNFSTAPWLTPSKPFAVSDCATAVADRGSLLSHFTLEGQSFPPSADSADEAEEPDIEMLVAPTPISF